MWIFLAANVNLSFAAMRKYEPRGPLVNSEFYTGWLDHWGEPHNTVATADVVRTLEQLFAANASFNFYMFIGGTNFGFTAGNNTTATAK
jgi:beta-galactosidase